MATLTPPKNEALIMSHSQQDLQETQRRNIHDPYDSMSSEFKDSQRTVVPSSPMLMEKSPRRNRCRGAVLSDGLE